RMLLPDVNERFANGAPACTPSLDEAWHAWTTITTTADPWLDSLTTEQLVAPRTFTVGDQQIELTFGNLLQRVVYHYWYHNGENMAIRQQLGHTNLAEFVGNIDDEAPVPPRLSLFARGGRCTTWCRTVGERIPPVRASLRRIAPVRRDASAQRATTRPQR